MVDTRPNVARDGSLRGLPRVIYKRAFHLRKVLPQSERDRTACALNRRPDDKFPFEGDFDSDIATSKNATIATPDQTLGGKHPRDQRTRGSQHIVGIEPDRTVPKTGHEVLIASHQENLMVVGFR